MQPRGGNLFARCEHGASSAWPSSLRARAAGREDTAHGLCREQELREGEASPKSVRGSWTTVQGPPGLRGDAVPGETENRSRDRPSKGGEFGFTQELWVFRVEKSRRQLHRGL